jgi:hypothetical protein
MTEAGFTERYRKWCGRNGYHFSGDKALDIIGAAIGGFPALPENPGSRLLVVNAAKQLTDVNVSLAVIKAEMLRCPP